MNKLHVVALTLTTCLATTAIAQADPLRAFARGGFHLAGKFHGERPGVQPGNHRTIDRSALARHLESNNSDNTNASAQHPTTTNDGATRTDSQESTPPAQARLEARAHAKASLHTGDSESS